MIKYTPNNNGIAIPKGNIARIGMILGAILLFFLLTPFVIIPSGHRGVLLTFGKPRDMPLGEGLHLRIPLVQRSYQMPVQIQRSETKSEAASRDLQRVTTTVALNYHVDPAQVVQVYRSTGAFENIDPRIIDPAVQETMKAITANYTAEELVTKRPTVSEGIRSALRDRLGRHGVVVDEFSVTNFRFSDSFDQAIEAKTVAEQQKLKAERDLERIEVEAQQRIAEAKGAAESAKLNAEAQAVALKAQRDAVTPQLIELRRVEAQLRAIEKWDGRMPQFSGGALPFINVQPSQPTQPTR
jgi:regulator of protease activity HflC (stomatin/prohibitin superfamily)